MRSFANTRFLCSALFALAACGGDGATPAVDVDDATENACACELSWEVDSVTPCIAAPTLSNPPLIYSSYPDQADNDVASDPGGDALPDCDAYVAFPQPVPSEPWATHRFRSTCDGQATLCVALKHGQAEEASEDDCLIMEHCFDVDYQDVGEVVELPPLPAWSGQDGDCNEAYYYEGGYVEFRATGGIGCSDRADVRRIQMCPSFCTTKSPLTEAEIAECNKCVGSSLQTDF